MSCLILFFCFKQKTAYEMRISDWSSDVCSSDLARPQRRTEAHGRLPQRQQRRGEQAQGDADEGRHKGEAEQRFLPAEPGERQVENQAAGGGVLCNRVEQPRRAACRFARGKGTLVDQVGVGEEIEVSTDARGVGEEG